MTASESANQEVVPSIGLQLRMEGLKSSLRRLSAEKSVYIAILCIAATASVVYIVAESTDEPSSSVRVLGPGWSWISRRQDIADFEWTFWLSDLRNYALLALFGHAAVSLLSAHFFPLFKSILQSIFCIHCLRAIFGIPYVLLVVAQCACFYIAAQTRSARTCWIVTIGNVLFLHVDSALLKVIPRLLFCSDMLEPIAYAGLAFSALRCCSFVLEKNNAKNGRDGGHDLYELLQYNFYLPYFFFGPVMTYDVFEKKDASVPPKEDVVKLVKESMKTVAGIITVDVLFHFLYISSLAGDTEFLRNAPSHVIGFLLFSNVLLDWGKAWILYQLTSEVCSVIDGYKNAPRAPKCLAKLCTFAHTYFDRGTQHWLCRYIYDPIGLSHSDVAKEAPAGAVTFMFVSVWLGPSVQVLIWALLNWFGLTFEFFVGAKAPQTLKKNKRLVAFVLGINYWCILLFNAVGINGLGTASESFQILFFNGNLWSIAVSLLLSYCYVALITLGGDAKAKKE